MATVLAVALAAAACSGGDDDPSLGPIETPEFSEDEADATRSTGDPIDLDETDSTGTTAGGTDPDGSTTTTEGTRTEKVSFDDPVGDATPGVGTGTPPPWTDLAGASLERQGNAYRLIVRLGGDVPETAPGSETMNIATFFDIDGDDGIEYDLWVNLGEEGWGPVWYDENNRAAIGDNSNVTVIVDGTELQMLFPDVMLRRPQSLRFSIASEYGVLATIGTDTARRDDAPDNDRAVAFP